MVITNKYDEQILEELEAEKVKMEYQFYGFTTDQIIEKYYGITEEYLRQRCEECDIDSLVYNLELCGRNSTILDNILPEIASLFIEYGSHDQLEWFFGKFGNKRVSIKRNTITRVPLVYMIAYGYSCDDVAINNPDTIVSLILKYCDVPMVITQLDRRGDSIVIALLDFYIKHHKGDKSITFYNNVKTMLSQSPTELTYPYYERLVQEHNMSEY